MPPIPFNSGQASGLEDLAGAQPLVLNSLVDVTGTIKARPGISAWSGFPATVPEASPVVAMVPFGSFLLYVTLSRNIYVVEPGGATVTAASSADAATKLNGTQRPVLYALQDKVVMAGGGAPQKWPGYGLASRLGGGPPNMSHIVGLATRLLGNRYDASGIFQWSFLGATGHETWDAYNYAEAEAKSDVLKALATNTNELFALGAETLQVYSPDPQVGFAAGRTANVGLIAPYSVVTFDDQLVFLDREKRFVNTDGRGFSSDQVISKPIQKSIRALSTVTDCWGFRLRVDRWDAGCWIFPTDGKGFLWNKDLNQWSEWRAWGASGYQAPKITSAVYWPERDLMLVGLDTGQIAKLDASAFTDLGDIIRVELVSGAVNHGTDALKHSRQAKLVFKRGETVSGTAPPVQLSWRDDHGAYCEPIVIDLGTGGDYNPVVTLYSLGSPYRRRQWKLEYTSAAEFAFIGAEEEITVLAA